MPRIPTHQVEDDWEDPDELNIEPDEVRDRLGRKMPREEREREVQRREVWRKRYREE